MSPDQSAADPAGQSASGASTPDSGGRVPRRELFSTAASSVLGLVAACGPAPSRTTVVSTPEGKVLQWEGDDLLVLVSGLQDAYGPGDAIRLKVMLNNQTNQAGLYRVRTKLVGRGDQALADVPVANVQVKPYDATEIERTISLPSSVAPGDYTLVLELPPWSLAGRTTGGGSLSAPVRVRP